LICSMFKLEFPCGRSMESTPSIGATESQAAHPEDHEILAHERDIRREAEASPPIGPQLSLDELKAQYAGNSEFLPKVVGLQERCTAMRRTRPDGNCFYRAYLFGILEQLGGQKGQHANFEARAKSSLEYCINAGYERVTIEDFYEEFMTCVDKIISDPAATMTAFNESDVWLVCWARCLTSAYLKTHQDEYHAFLTSHSTILEFCAQEVDPMNTEADHLQIVALSSFFTVPVSVVYLDRSQGEEAAEHFFQDNSSTCSMKPVHLLYRPGHYDLIYSS